MENLKSAYNNKEITTKENQGFNILQEQVKRKTALRYTDKQELNKIKRERLSKYMFKKGISGNPKGRPKGKTLKEFARAYLMTLDGKAKKKFLAALPPDVIWRMAEGNPPQDLNLGGNDDLPISIKIIEDK